MKSNGHDNAYGHYKDKSKGDKISGPSSYNKDVDINVYNIYHTEQEMNTYDIDGDGNYMYVQKDSANNAGNNVGNNAQNGNTAINNAGNANTNEVSKSNTASSPAGAPAAAVPRTLSLTSGLAQTGQATVSAAKLARSRSQRANKLSGK